MLHKELSYGVILFKIYISSVPKLEPWSLKMCKGLVLCAKVDNVGRTGQKM